MFACILGGSRRWTCPTCTENPRCTCTGLFGFALVILSAFGWSTRAYEVGVGVADSGPTYRLFVWFSEAGAVEVGTPEWEV
jgi:hypothetical protein